MLLVGVAIGAAVLAGVAGYAVGGAKAARTISRRLLTSREDGVAMLEALARTWGARLELFQLPGEAGRPPEPR